VLSACSGLQTAGDEWHRCRVLHPPVECEEEEEEDLRRGLQDAGEEWHHSGVLHPPAERGEEEGGRPAAHQAWRQGHLDVASSPEMNGVKLSRKVWLAVEAGQRSGCGG
jgi:hypothetical protein